MIYRLASIVLFSAFSPCWSQVTLDNVSDSLKNGCNELILEDNTTFSIYSMDKCIKEKNQRVAILKKTSKNFDEIVLYYDSFRKLKKAEVTIYDQYGKKRKSFRLNDFDDLSASQSNLASDARVKILPINEAFYPFIIEINYLIEYNNTYNFPRWVPQFDEKQSLLNASFEIRNHTSIPIRHKEVNCKIDTIYRTKDYESLNWSVSNLSPIIIEPHGHFKDIATCVYTAPSSFIMDNRQGSMASWPTFGQWIYDLNKDQNTLDTSQLGSIKNSIQQCPNLLDSIKQIYKYVQNNSRYVSVQLGIGGLQPFESGFVHEQKYGDCKALCFYTKCILESMGIDAYYTLIGAGRGAIRVDDSFPDDYFNHIIVTIPLATDTIWLECTSQTNPFGYLGTFTGNRFALMIKDHDSQIIETKKYNSFNSTTVTKANIDIDSIGNAIADIHRLFSGTEMENKQMHHVINLSPSKIKEWYIDQFSIGNMELRTIKLEHTQMENDPAILMSVHTIYNNLLKKTGNRWFLTNSLLSEIKPIDLSLKTRKSNLYIDYPYAQKDSIVIQVPKGLVPESGMKSHQLETVFGIYEKETKFIRNEIIITRSFHFSEEVIQPSQYEAFKEFIKNVQKFDNEMIVFTSQN